MTQKHYGSGPDNVANVPTDSADGPWLSPIEDFLPAELAGNPDADAVLDDPGAGSRRWVEIQSGLLYRFRIGDSAPRGGANSTNGGSQAAATSTSDETSSITNRADIGSAAGFGSGDPDARTGANAVGGGGTGSATSSATLAVSTVQIGAPGGLVFNITYDSSVAAAPAGFTAAISYVAQFYASNFSSPITINLDVGWGEIAGQAMSSGALGESETYLNSYSYNQVRSALISHATSADQKTAVGSLPITAPTGSSSYSIATAEAKALGLMGASSSLDGYVGFGSGYPYTFDPNSRAVSGQYDFIGVAAHEITEVMGRGSYLGEGLGYTVLDLFRYSNPGTRQLTAGRTAYFSIDGGSTNLDNFNTASGGDSGDWASSAGNDAYNAFSNSGVQNRRAIPPFRHRRRRSSGTR